nr:hypothetical protein B0A51_17384 [Rachicladosporium sp. CCFEE 5018]
MHSVQCRRASAPKLREVQGGEVLQRLAGLHQPGPTNESRPTAQNGQTRSRPGVHVVDSQPCTAIRDGTFLHNRTEEKTFQLLIDCLRLAQEDFHKFSSVNLEGSIYAGSPSSEPAFRTFIASAKSRRTSSHHGGPTRSLRSAFSTHEKSDIQETYGDNSMPMKLRMLAEKIHGHPPSGQPGASMLNMQASMETGSRQGWASTTIDMQNVR